MGISKLNAWGHPAIDYRPIWGGGVEILQLLHATETGVRHGGPPGNLRKQCSVEFSTPGNSLNF